MGARHRPRAELIRDADESIAYYQRFAVGDASQMRLGLYMSRQWRKLLDEPQPDREELELFATALEGNADWIGIQWHYMSLAVRWWIEQLDDEGKMV